MYSILLPLFATALATVAQAYTKPGANTWGPLLTPDLSHPVTQGKDFTVTWDPESHDTDGVTVSLVLCHGNSANCVLADDAIASGIPADQKSFDWKVPCDLTPGTQSTATGYGMLIIVDGTGEFQYSTQFSVLESKTCSSSSTLASSNTTSTITSNGSVIILPPSQQTGSLSSSENATAPYTSTPTGSSSGETATTAAAGSNAFSFGSYTLTGTSELPGTTVFSGLTTATTQPTGTTAVGGATETASAPGTSTSTFDGGAGQVGWNAAGVVVAGAVALFAL